MSVIGIDLGTTNTVVAIDQEVIEIADGDQSLLPSVVGFPPSGATVVGESARRRKTIDPKNTIYSAKRIIGRGWHSADTAAFKKRYPFDLVEVDGGPGFATRGGVHTPTRIAAQLLDAAARHPRIAPLQRTTKAVIAVPSQFGPDERRATMEAAIQAGFPHAALLDEPAATAAAYLSRFGVRGDYAAVYDFGGGTFDLAIVDCQSHECRILAHAGDLYLGGDDVDLALADWAAKAVLAKWGWDLKDEPETYQRLVVACEKAKIRFSKGGPQHIDLKQVDPAAPPGVDVLELNEPIVAKLCLDLVRRTFFVCDEVLRHVGLTVDRIDSILVAGGATLLPVVRDGIEKYFSKKVDYAFNPMHIVAIGASTAGI